MARDLKLQAVITADNRTKGAFLDLKSNVESVGNMIKGAFKTAMVAGAAGIAAVTYESVQMMKAGREALIIQAKFENAMINIAGATKETTAELSAYAEQLMWQTGISDEVVKDSMAMMATFHLSAAEIKSMTPKLADMAAMFSKNTGEMTDMQQMAIMLGKATGGELWRNLQRIGIVFDENEIKMLENADAGERFRIIMEEVGSEFGGTAEAMMKADPFGQLNLIIDETKEKLGIALLEGLKPWIDALKDWASSPQASEQVKNFATAITENLQKAFQWFMDNKEEIWGFFQGIWDFFVVIGKVVGWIWGAFNLLAQAIANVISFFIDMYEGAKKAVIDTYNTIASWFTAIKNFVSGPINAIKGFFGEVFNVAKEMWQKIYNSVTEWWGKAVDWVKNNNPFRGFGEGIKGIGDFFSGKGFMGMRQSGGSVLGGRGYVVGENGPEYFVPNQSGNIVNNQMASRGSSGASITVNIGMYAGSETEKARVAEELLRAVTDRARARNQSVSQMFGVI